MATQKKKKEVKEKKRLIISYDKLPQEGKDAFEQKYEEGFMDYIQSVTRPDGSPMFVVPLETEEAVYMVKVDVKVDSKLTDDEFDKEILHTSKDDEDNISTLVGGDSADIEKQFTLNHGDYSAFNTLEKEAAKEDMDADSFASIDDLDIVDSDINTDF